MATDYRWIILQRLKERDRHCDQFASVFNSYNVLSESMNHLLAKGGSIKRKRRSPTECEYIEDVKELEMELADLYKKKAINDQQLIDANRRLKVLEEQVETVTNDHNKILKTIDETDRSLLVAENDVSKLKQANTVLNEEFNASQALYQRISAKYVVANQECKELIDQIKEMKSKEVLILNEFNDCVEKRRIDKIRSDIEEATKQTQSFDVFGGTSHDSLIGSDDISLELLGDVIPERCRVKIEANEMGEINDCAFHPDGNHFFTAGNDRRVKMFEIAGERCNMCATFDGANQALTRIDFETGSQFLLASSYDKTVRLWSAKDRRLRATFTGHSDKVVAAKFFAGGRSIASGSNDRSIKIFDIANNRCSHTLFAGSMVLDVTTNDRFAAPIISSHYDKSVRFWDPCSDREANSFKLGGKVTSLCVSYDGLSVLCSCRDETLSLVDIRNNGIIHIYSAEQYRTASDYCKCVMSPGGTYIASGSADGHIFVWNTNTTRLEKVLHKNAHENSPILSLAWHPRGHVIISGDKRKTLCLWK